MHVGDDVIVSVAECMAKALARQALCRRASPATGSPRSSRTRAWRRPRQSPSRSAPRPRPSCRAPARARSKCRSASASRRSAAPTTRSRMPWPPRRSPARLPRTAAATASRCSRIPTRASSGATPTSWSIGKLRDALGNDSFRLDAQPILPLRGNYGRPRFELLIRMLGDRGEMIPPGQVSLLGGALPAHADGRSLGGASRLRTARRTQRVGGRGYRALRHQSVRPIAAGRVFPRVRGR